MKTSCPISLTLALTAVLLIVSSPALADPVVLRIATSKGTLIVETEDPDVEVLVKHIVPPGVRSQGRLLAADELRHQVRHGGQAGGGAGTGGQGRR